MIAQAGLLTSLPSQQPSHTGTRAQWHCEAEKVPFTSLP